MDAKNRPRSPYNCVICGRNTNNKRYFVEEWGNYFFACSHCKKVWCVDCMGQMTGLGQRKVFRAAKRGKMKCVNCQQFLPMIKLPQNLPFVQENTSSMKNQSEISEEYVEKKFCPLLWS